jgi:hypothetical protein
MTKIDSTNNDKLNKDCLNLKHKASAENIGGCLYVIQCIMNDIIIPIRKAERDKYIELVKEKLGELYDKDVYNYDNKKLDDDYTKKLKAIEEKCKEKNVKKM